MRKHLLVAAGVVAGVIAAGGIAMAEFNPGVMTQYDSLGKVVSAPDNFAAGSPSRTSSIKREEVNYEGPYGKGTIVVDTAERRLYYVMGDGKAMKYGIGVGRPGFQWSGTHNITRKAEWPGWTPPPAMRKRQPGLPAFMPGGPNNPLGARAMYIGSTIYRIHGSNEPWTMGQAVSSGCIRMTNDDVADLYERVPVGTRVVVQH
ncbi:MAG: L,D-transpeptidase [Hyphomicrobiales bacterium]